jgi:hypothetical protein
LKISQPGFCEDEPGQDIDEFDEETFADEDEVEQEDDTEE